MDRSERIKAALFGLLIGDALGVPYEFHPPEDLPPLEQIEFEPPPHFSRTHVGTPPGTWSDDGAQALCLLASLLTKGKLELEDFGRRLLNWYDYGYMAVDYRVFDVGVSTGEALRRLKSGHSPHESGLDHPHANGNGSLMRVLPLALWHKGSDLELIRDAEMQSVVTHRHLCSQICCALYCLWARNLLEERTDAWILAVQTLIEVYRHDAAKLAELNSSIRPLKPYKTSGTGYVVDCLHSAKSVAQAATFEEVVKRAIVLGNDTDTTACVAGGIAGLIHGFSGIPERWLEGLRGKELVEPLLKQLLA